MANKAKEKTAKQKAAEQASKALAAAKEARLKNDNANTKNAVEKAENAYEAAKMAERRERFLTVGSSRVVIVSQKLGALSKCANKRGYEFTKADIDKMRAKLTAELETALHMFENALAGKTPAARSSNFSFE